MMIYYFLILNSINRSLLTIYEVYKSIWFQEIVSMQENNLPTAPDFTLEDSKGQTVTLSQFEGQKNVLLVFNRGFL